MTKFLKFTYLFLFVFLCATSYGKTVDENTAKTVGSNYLISAGVQGVKSSSDLTISYVATATVGGKAINDFYVFNIVGGKGFVMVSADDIVQPVLAYSNEASFDINNISPEAKFWIEGYQNQITYVIANNTPALAGTSDAWKDLSTTGNSGARTTYAVGTYLCTTTWDQGQSPYSSSSAYNNLCPGSGSTKSYTGCVATAMAQVMKYWNWPTVGTGSHTYTPATNGSLYGAQTVDFGNTVYNWTSMPNTISISNYLSIATLMYHAGVATDMDYGYTSAGSGTYVIFDWSPILNCAQYALPTYFKYKPSLQGLSRSSPPSGAAAIPQTTWINYLTTEFNAGRPVIYSGFEASGGGHCWVADGYDASNNIHFNWGWGGTGPNGFYSVNSIAPPSLGAGGGSGNFNTDQSIIIGIEPDSVPASATGNIKMLSYLDCPTNSPIASNTGFSVTAKFLNSGSTSFNGNLCVQVFDTSNNLIGTLQTMAETITAGDSTASLTFSTTGFLKMIPGMYILKAMYQTSGSAPWTAVANNGTLFVNYNVISVANTNLLELYDSMQVTPQTGVPFHTIRRGSVLTMGTKVGNFATGDFNGTVQAVLINIATGASYTVQQYTGQTIAANRYANYTFTSSPVTAPGGNYILAVQHQPGGSGSYIYTGSLYYENPVLINIIGAVDVSTVNATTDKVTVYPNPAKDQVYIDLNGLEAGRITITDVEGRQLRELTPAANQSAINIPVAGFAPGIYFVSLQTGGGIITKKIVITK